MQKQLLQDHFDNVIRWVKRVDVDRLNQLSTMFGAALIRLGAKRRTRSAVKGIPDGSDQYDSGSLLEWLGNVRPEDVEAVAQVVAIDATIQNRLGG